MDEQFDAQTAPADTSTADTQPSPGARVWSRDEIEIIYALAETAKPFSLAAARADS